MVAIRWCIPSGPWLRAVPWAPDPGLGESDVIPAGYTDLIVSVLGEEWGFLGIAAVYAIFGLLIWMGLRIARRARTDYAFFLALGLTLLIAGELLLISGGILDLFPLSGVATPFLSYGRTAMLANFLIAGILLALGRDRGPPPVPRRSTAACDGSKSCCASSCFQSWARRHMFSSGMPTPSRAKALWCFRPMAAAVTFTIPV